MILTLLTVFSAGVLGGALFADITVIVAIAAVALVLIGAFNGVRNLVHLCELRPRD